MMTASISVARGIGTGSRYRNPKCLGERVGRKYLLLGNTIDLCLSYILSAHIATAAKPEARLIVLWFLEAP